MDFDLLPEFTRSPFTLEGELDQMQWAFPFGQLKMEARVIAFNLRDGKGLGASHGKALSDLDARLDDSK